MTASSGKTSSYTPRHPDTSDLGAVSDGRTSVTRPRRIYALVVMVIALLVVMIVLHLTGVMGPGTH